MKLRNSRKSVRIIALFLSLVFFTLTFFPAYATKTVDKPEDEVSELESELSDLEKEQKALDKELNQILSKIKTTNSELKEVREELAIAKGKEAVQYESMMTRIKYMYENGNATILEMLFSSKCMAEFISKAEYFSAITEYDRELLAEYKENREAIAASEAKLEEAQEYLGSLQKELASKEKKLSADFSEYTAKIQQAKAEAKEAEEEAKKPVKPVVPEKPQKDPVFNKAPAATNGSAVSYTEEDVILLAAIIECEAGYKDYDALLAVGAVVVNRMKHANYPNTVYGVIYQSGQFPPATSGKMDKILERGTKELCETAARDALNGKTNVEDCISFRAANSGYVGTIIGDNVFFF